MLTISDNVATDALLGRLGQVEPGDRDPHHRAGDGGAEPGTDDRPVNAAIGEVAALAVAALAGRETALPPGVQS
jgi:hypothetical protein